MGLFKSFFKKVEQPSPTAQADAFPELYNGMKMEVLTPANTLIFVGRLKVMDRDLLELRSENGGLLPRAIYNQPVKLRGFQRDGQTFTLYGAIGPNGPDFWRIERLRNLQSSENRSFFRQNTGVEGFISSTTSSKNQKFSCKVLDISGGGARIVTQKLLDLEALFQLEAPLLTEEAPFFIPCQVKRIVVHSKPGSSAKRFEYGCQFLEMPQKEQERLLQAIFTLQRKVLQARRD